MRQTYEQQCKRQRCRRRRGQFLDPALLLLLEQAPAHGYTLLSRLAEFGMDYLAPTVVYRALRDMETRDWVTSTWEEEQSQGPPRRIYTLTPTGREILRCCLIQLRDTQQVLEYFLALHDELAPPSAPGTLQQTIKSQHKESNMQIVIPATGSTLEAAPSTVFGRCAVFVFVDPETMEIEALENPALGAPGGAGVQAAQTVLQQGVQAVVAPRLGPNAFRVIQAAGVPVYQIQGSTVREVAEAFQAGTLARIDAPGADHVGLGRGGGRRGQGRGRGM